MPFTDCEKTKTQNPGQNSMYLVLILLVPDHFISAHKHCPHLSPDHFISAPNIALISWPFHFSPKHYPNLSPIVIAFSVLTNVVLYADCIWIFEISLFSKSHPRFDFLSKSQCYILCLDYEKMSENVRHLKNLTLSKSLFCVSSLGLYLFNFFHYFLFYAFLGNIE